MPRRGTMSLLHSHSVSVCLDLVLTMSEARQLMDHSVGHHMRLLTGITTNSEGFYMHLPSEPILVMGSIKALYQKLDYLGKALDTLSKDLCSAGLIEKDILGELCVHTLLLIAHNFATPIPDPLHGQNYLKPVPLMFFLDKLFGRALFNSSDRNKFEDALAKCTSILRIGSA